MKKKSQCSAFSMVEISVSIIIITAIMLGIVKGQALFVRARLATARTLTQNSVVKDISDLAMWYETSLESSFLFNEERNVGSISVWQDNSGNPSKNNAVQSTSGNQPKFYENIFNGAIPAVRFDGVDDFLTFDGSALIGTSYTVLVVEQRRASSNLMSFLGGSNNSTSPNNLQLGYRSNAAITHAHSTSILNDFTVSTYSVPTPAIHTFWFSISDGQKYWLNGGSTADDSNSGMTTALTGYAGAAIGRYISSYLSGDIAEIIVFKRALQTQERQMVETYLSQKFGITIS